MSFLKLTSLLRTNRLLPLRPTKVIMLVVVTLLLGILNHHVSNGLEASSSSVSGDEHQKIISARANADTDMAIPCNLPVFGTSGWYAVRGNTTAGYCSGGGDAITDITGCKAQCTYGFTLQFLMSLSSFLVIEVSFIIIYKSYKCTKSLF